MSSLPNSESILDLGGLELHLQGGASHAIVPGRGRATA